MNLEKTKKSNKSIIIMYIILGIVIFIFVELSCVIGLNLFKSNNKNKQEIPNPNQSNSTNSKELRNSPRNSNGHTAVDPAKPIIYLYPEEQTEVEVKLGNPQYLSCTYPKYKEGWKVIANPGGNLIDKNTGRDLYALYWEGKNIEVKEQKLVALQRKGFNLVEWGGSELK